MTTELHDLNPDSKSNFPTREDLLAAALHYATLGWAVFICRPRTKEPGNKHSFKEATTNPETIKRLWRYWPANIAVATGPQSRLFVLDVDGEVGAQSLRELEFQHGRLPDTLRSFSSRGPHYWFATENHPIPNSAEKIAPKLDIRGDGGYVLAPPSVHPSGAIYRWLTPPDTPILPAPEWLVKLAQKPKPKLVVVNAPREASIPKFTGELDAYGRTALENEIAALERTPRGSRNHQLNRASFCLHQLVAGGELDAAEVERRLIDAAQANGLLSDPEDGECRTRKTIASGASAGLQNPRSRRGQS
jgi:hypothetical protein